MFCVYSFETIPQVTLQVLLFTDIIQGKGSTNITDQDLILSIGSAVLNTIVQLLRLKLESRAVKEAFIQYSLNCITARFGWIPFKHLLEQFGNKVDEEENGSMDKSESIPIRNKLSIDFTVEYKIPLKSTFIWVDRLYLYLFLSI